MAKGRQAAKACNERWKRAAHAALGGKCALCGFTDIRALQIDHVNGGGTREHHRRKPDGNNWRRICLSKYYRLVVEDQTGKYQLLCANCNWIKRTTNGEIIARTVRAVAKAGQKAELAYRIAQLEML